MGNANSSGGTLSIILDPPDSSSYYVAGETISGSVYAQSKSNISSQIPLNIAASVHGIERTCVRYADTEHFTNSKGESQSRTVTRYNYATRQIIHMAVDLGGVDTSVQAGARFRFPFRIQLPPDLPGSMFCNEHHTSSFGGGHCEITYKIMAELKKGGMFGLGSRKVEQTFQVSSAPHPVEPVPNLIPPFQREINMCCCIGLGSITMGARVENTRIGRGEQVAVDFACKNQSLRGIKRAVAQIVEEVRWSAQGRSNYSEKAIATRTFQPSERWKKISRDEMKELKQKRRDLNSSYRGKQAQMLQMIHAAIFDGEDRTLIDVPTSSFQSYQGMLIHVEHRLRITVYMDGFCTDNPKIKLPLCIGTPSGLLGGLPTPVSGDCAPAIATSVLMPSAPPLPSTMPEPSAPPAEWAEAVTATPILVGGSTAVLGGTKIWEGTGQEEQEIYVAVAEVVPSLQNLLKELEYSINPLSTVRKRMNEEEWRQKVFEVITPTEYASLIDTVAIEFDQPEIATAVAPIVRGGNFTHEYILSALRVVSNWLRISLIQKLLPLCKDLDRNANKIKAVLSDWERVCTERDFEEATKINSFEQIRQWDD